MTSSRLSLCLVVAMGALAAGPAVAAGSDHGLRGGPPVMRRGLPVDRALLPPNTGPGDCLTRRITGPGGVHRWDRIECDPDRGWTSFDAWGFGRYPLDVETFRPPMQADEHGPRGHAELQPGPTPGDTISAHRARNRPEDRPDARPEDRYGPHRGVRPDYLYAGRDTAGYLVWPGKQP